MTKGQTYRQYVTPKWEVLQADMSRAMFGRELTPLHEVVAPTIDRLPRDISAQITREFWKRHDASNGWEGKYAAQDWLANEVGEFEREKIHRAFDENEIRALASRWSDLCRRMQRVEVMQDFGRSVGITPPEVQGNVSRVGVARRMGCPRWWRRQIRKHYTRRAESHLRAAGFVHRRRQVYASDRAVEHRRQRKSRDKAMLQEMVAISDDGEQLELWSVVEKSQANPALRRAELMTRLRGFEEVAKLAGHEAEFITLTCPSAMHRTLDNGTRNPLWQGATPREGQQWLCKLWARARSKLKRMSVAIYGFRIAEPHHDGTPHWHMVLFATAANLAIVQQVLRGVWLSEYGDEDGAQKYRSKFQRINPAKGSAAGYLAKYVAKNIDGYEVGEDFEAEKPANESCDRVAAWASAHGIRQFQQIGGPAVTVWRELRRLRSEVSNHPAIEAARKAADAGEWSEFVAAVGGIAAGRKGSVQMWMESTGELNQYDELRAPQIAGVEARRYGFARSSTVFKALPFYRYERDGRAFVRHRMSRRSRTALRATCDVLSRVRTRVKVWRIERKKPSGLPAVVGESGNKAGVMRPAGFFSPSSLGPVSITVRGSRNMPAGTLPATSREGPPWMH